MGRWARFGSRILDGEVTDFGLFRVAEWVTDFGRFPCPVALRGKAACGLVRGSWEQVRCGGVCPGASEEVVPVGRPLPHG